MLDPQAWLVSSSTDAVLTRQRVAECESRRTWMILVPKDAQQGERMRSTKSLIVTILIASQGFISAPAFAQKASTTPQAVPSSPPDQADLTKRMVELSKPGENHKLLASLAGTWEFTGKHFPDDPSEKPIEIKGSCVRKPLWEGRYFLTETTGGKLPMPWADGREVAYKDMILDGFDNLKMKFVRAMIDNHWDTGILTYEGNYDAVTRTIAYEAELEDSPRVKTKTRWLLRIQDNDHYMEEIYEEHDGRQVKGTEIHYRRVKGK